MARNLLCLLGWHDYVERRNEDGEPYTECRRCGKFNVTPDAWSWGTRG
jgi:hypothetical protein